MEYRYTAIVLKKLEVGETDRLYTFYTKEQGKVRAVAKGIRKSGAKLASQLENGTFVDVSVARTRGTGKITGALAEECYPKLRAALGILRGVCMTLYDFERLVQFDEPDETLFSLLADFLRCADHSATRGDTVNCRLLSSAFLFQAVAHLGYAMEARVSAVSGRRFFGSDTSEHFFFSPSQGGVVFASECGEHPVLPMSQNAIKLLRVFQTHPLSAVMHIRVDSRELKEVEGAARRMCVWVQ